MITIQSNEVGRFTSVPQKRVYDKALQIMGECNNLAGRAIALDNNTSDDHNKDQGFVLLDRASLYNDSFTSGLSQMIGSCKFEPSTRTVESLDMTAISVRSREANREVIVTNTAVSGKISQQNEQTTYETIDGKVIVDRLTGNLMVEEGSGASRQEWTSHRPFRSRLP